MVIFIDLMFLTRIVRSFGQLHAQFQSNKLRNAVRFENQDIDWDYEQVHYYTQALSKGLNQFAFK